jgi:hypothetical protein
MSVLQMDHSPYYCPHCREEFCQKPQNGLCTECGAPVRERSLPAADRTLAKKPAERVTEQNLLQLLTGVA